MMRFFETAKGSISVFLILVMFPLYTCVYLAIEAATYADLSAKAGGALNLVGNTALANYDLALKELYGILAMSRSESELSDILSTDYSIITGTNGTLLSVFVESSSLKYPDILDRRIKESMKYKAPYNWASSVLEKLSVFTEASALLEVFEKSKEYYKALSNAKDEVQKLYESIGKVNLNSSPEEIISSLKNIQSLLPKFKNALDKSNDKASGYKQAVEDIESKEIKAMLENDLGSVVVDDKVISSFENALKSDMENIRQKEEPITLDDLSFVENPLYSYITSSCAVGGEDGDSSVKDSLDEISKTDLNSFIKTIAEVKVTDLIKDSVYKDIFSGKSEAKEHITLSEKISIDAENSFLIEFVSENFNCLTYPLTNAALPGEQEYILFGSNRASLNISLCVDLIFAVRLLLNSVFVFTNSQMRQAALSVATAVAGATGIGVPIAQNLLLLSWAAAESILDTASLCKGEAVPIYKTSSTWTLGLGNISNVLAGGVSEYACKHIDDIFEELESITSDKVSQFKGNALDYANRTAESAVSSLADMVITPVVNKITTITSGVKVNYTEDELYNLFLSAANSVEVKSEGTKLAKDAFIKYCLPTLARETHEAMAGVFSEDKEISALAREQLESIVDSAYKTLSEKVYEEVDKYEKKFVEGVNSALDNVRDGAKDRVSSAISSYTESLSTFIGGAESGNSGSYTAGFAKSAGFCMYYEDYLKVFMLIGLAGQNTKSNMLRRCAVVMQINCSRKNSGFDITKCYTQISLRASERVGPYSFKEARLIAY